MRCLWDGAGGVGGRGGRGGGHHVAPQPATAGNEQATSVWSGTGCSHADRTPTSKHHQPKGRGLAIHERRSVRQRGRALLWVVRTRVSTSLVASHGGKILLACESGTVSVVPLLTGAAAAPRRPLPRRRRQ